MLFCVNENFARIMDITSRLFFFYTDCKDLTFSISMGGSSKAPANWKMQYSIDGTNFTDISNSNFTITSDNRKILTNYINKVKLPEDCNGAKSVTIRIIATSTTTTTPSTSTSSSKTSPSYSSESKQNMPMPPTPRGQEVNGLENHTMLRMAVWSSILPTSWYLHSSPLTVEAMPCPLRSTFSPPSHASCPTGVSPMADSLNSLHGLPTISRVSTSTTPTRAFTP